MNAAQAAVPVAAKKARFLYHYSLNDGSLGIHNPDYVREMLVQAQSLADSLP